MDPHLSQALRDISEQLSMILAMIICMIAAIIRWRRHRAVSMTVLIGCALLLIQIPAVAALYAWAPDAIIKSVNPANANSFRESVYMVMALCSNSFVALAFAVLVAAIFMKRSERPLN